MSKYTAVLQEPTVELVVETAAADGSKASIIVGFKRYGTEKAKLVRQKVTDMIKPLIEYQETTQDVYASYKFVDGEKVPDGELISKGKTFDEDKFKEVNELYLNNQKEFIKENISYIKNAKLVDGTTGKVAITIPDTRTFTEKQVWEDEGFTSILALILEVYLDSDIWRNALYSKAQFAIENKEEERKSKSKN